MLAVVAGGLQAGFTSYSKWLNGLRLDSQWEARLFQISFLPRARFSSSLKHDFAPAAYTRWAECSLGWLSSRAEQMGARGPHNLWSQVQFQAALEKEGNIFKVKFSPQSWKGWKILSINFPCIETDVRSNQRVSGRSSQPVRQDQWLERVWSEGRDIYFKQNGSEDCRHSRK